MTATLLRTQGLTAGYGATTILHDIDIEIPVGRIVAVVGPNGAGKTTLARTVAGFTRTFAGGVELDGEPIDGWSVARRARAGIASVPEGRRLFPDLSVQDNLDLALFPRRRELSAAERSERIDAAIEMFPVLRERATQGAGSLSGGEQQMLAIARALLLEPRLLILDEPSTGLAPIYVERIFERIQHVVETVGCGCLLIEQRAVTALAASSHAYALDRGRIIFAGPSEQIASDPRLRDTYLGGAAAGSGDADLRASESKMEAT
jgi:branched-chain amino acid transport system ATP-binding protein